MRVKELREWLATLDDADELVIDEGGTVLCVVDGREWIEVGWDGDRTEAQP